MRSSFLKIMALTFALLVVLTACAPTPNPSVDSTDATTEAPTTEEVATEAATTEEATTEAETTEEATTEAPTTEGATTEAPTTEEATTEEQKAEEPKEKNVLMIGNSFCYYYVEELSAMARVDGYSLTVANLYKSGAPLSDQYDSYKSGETVGELFVTQRGRRKSAGQYSFKEALEYAQTKLGVEWDVITLQGSSRNALLGNPEADIEATLPYAIELYEYLKKEYSGAELYWHQTWSYEIGYGSDKISEIEKVTSAEKRTAMYEIKKATSYRIAEETGVKLMPTGDAWEIARKNALIGTTLCERSNVNGGLGDYYHDGDTGGGQYLNACVWYEVLMGKSCVGNTWRPSYELSEEKIAILQAAAHEAVAAVYGEDYAK